MMSGRSKIVGACAAALMAWASPTRAQGLRYEVVHAFEAPPPGAPQAAPVRASDGAFYGTLDRAARGNWNGALYRHHPASRGYTILHVFDGTTGTRPVGPMVEGPGPALYGTTSGGGAHGKGTLFRWDLAARVLTALHHFTAAEGSGNGALLLASDGRLYGATSVTSSTVLYRYDPATGAFAVVLVVTGGGVPAGPPIEAADGRLYGVGGCGQGAGAIYRYDPASASGGVVHTFVMGTGASPCAPLLEGADGDLYGSTTSGGATFRGVLFRFDPVTLAYTVLHTFDGPTGSSPGGALFQTPDGRLHGTAPSGGAHGHGTLFRYDLATAALSVVHDFGGTSGYAPRGPLVDAGDGSLIGAASGSSLQSLEGNGSLFRFWPATSAVATTLTFGNAGGSRPQADLLRGPGDFLYGTTAEGGHGGEGTLFRFDVWTGSLSTLRGFDGGLGGRPVAAVIAGADGALYGTTSRGGRYGRGTVFRHDVPTWQTTLVHEFGAPGSDGRHPMGALVQATDGALYGTTYGDLGPFFFDEGTIFRYDPATAAFTTVFSFPEDGGAAAALVQASDGMLYGTTSGREPSPSDGMPILFRWDPATSTFASWYFPGLSWPQAPVIEVSGGLYAGVAHWSTWGSIARWDLGAQALTFPFPFSGVDGTNPMSSLVRTPAGALVGTTERGGTFDRGTLFRYDPATNEHRVIHAFGATAGDGAFPRAGVAFGPDGALYGTTTWGGAHDGGTIFRLRGVR